MPRGSNWLSMNPQNRQKKPVLTYTISCHLWHGLEKRCVLEKILDLAQELWVYLAHASKLGWSRALMSRPLIALYTFTLFIDEAFPQSTCLKSKIITNYSLFPLFKAHNNYLNFRPIVSSVPVICSTSKTPLNSCGEIKGWKDALYSADILCTQSLS